MLMRHGVIVPSTGPKENFAAPGRRPLFRSTVVEYGLRAIDVILTGKLDDFWAKPKFKCPRNLAQPAGVWQLDTGDQEIGVTQSEYRRLERHIHHRMTKFRDRSR